MNMVKISKTVAKSQKKQKKQNKTKQNKKTNKQTNKLALRVTHSKTVSMFRRLMVKQENWHILTSSFLSS